MRFVLRALLSMSWVASAEAAAAATVVYPTGTYPTDVAHVQAALDGGGTVLLKATDAAGAPTAFNFGPSDDDGGWVEFRADAELVGERAGRAETVIEGGWYPVESTGAAQHIAVRRITFRNSYDGALLLYAANAEVTGNRVFHVVGRNREPDHTYAEAIVVGQSVRVLIEENVIDDLEADHGIGISQFRATGSVVIRRNAVGGTPYGTIESSSNVDTATGVPAPVRIAENALRPGPNGFGVGIEINGDGAYHVARNVILIESPLGLGIYALGAPEYGIAAMVGPVIERNRVRQQPRTDQGPVYGDGIDLVGTVQHAKVRRNTIDGAAYSALGLYDVPSNSDDLGFNALLGNRIAGFAANTADVFLDTAAHDTAFKGFCRTVIDLGVNNHVTCRAALGRAGAAGHPQAAKIRDERMHVAIDMLRQHGVIK